jgi:hypothetical protein
MHILCKHFSNLWPFVPISDTTSKFTCSNLFLPECYWYCTWRTTSVQNFSELTHHHSRSWALLEKLPIVQLLENFPAFYGTRMFITVFTRALHWSLFWARSIQSIPSHPISLRSILTLATHLRLGLPSVLFLLAFPPISYMHSSHLCYIPCPSHPHWLDHSIYTWRNVQVMKLILVSIKLKKI